MRKRTTHCKVCGVELTPGNSRTKMSRSSMCYTHWRDHQNELVRQHRKLWAGKNAAARKWDPNMPHRVNRVTRCKRCGVGLTPENNGLPGMGRTAYCNEHCREMKNDQFRKWYYKNREKILAQKRALSGRYGTYYLARRAHSFNGNNGGKFLTKEDIESMLAKQLRHCAMCNSDLVDKNWEIDHIIPKKLGGSHEMSNLEIICHACNRGKWTMTKDQYIAHCCKVFEQDRMRKEKEQDSYETKER